MNTPRITRLGRAAVGAAGLCLAAGSLHAQSWEPRHTGATAEIRGLSITGDAVWAGGVGGVWVRSADAGATWSTGVVPGAERLFFIDAHAVSADTAFLLGTHFEGGLARVYRTADGGRSWALQYERGGDGVFFDGMAFWDSRHGVAFGDPVDGTFTVIRTDDGGATWREVPAERLPRALPDEAGYAASGTSMLALDDSLAWFGTGGAATARVILTRDGGGTWSAVETALPAGFGGGIFGLAFRDGSHGIAVGGNHESRESAGPNVLVTRDGGRSWHVAGRTEPPHVKYGVVHAERGYVAVGPEGGGVSSDGVVWRRIPGEGFNTVAAAGDAVWAAGTEGRIARLRW